MNASSNPLIRPQTPFERRMVDAVERGKPGRSVGVNVKPLPGGHSLIAARQRASTVTPPPLNCYIGVSSGESLKLQVRPGTILSEMPEISVGGSPARLDASTLPYLVLPKTGTRYVVFNIEMTYSIADGQFTRPTIVDASVTITLETSSPGSSGAESTSGAFHFLLATFVDGKKTLQNGYGPITGELCDTLEGTHKARLNLNYPGT